MFFTAVVCPMNMSVISFSAQFKWSYIYSQSHIFLFALAVLYPSIHLQIALDVLLLVLANVLNKNT